VNVHDFKEIVSANIDSLAGYSGDPRTLDGISTEEYLDITSDIEKLALSFVHSEKVLKDSGDPDNDDDWVDSGQLNWMIVELDTDARTARIIPNVEASINDYDIGMVI
jgi:hypothetical protein